MAIDESKMKKDTLQGRSDQLISTAELMNAIQGKIFELFTSGGEAAISSEDNFFCWLTPGVPVSASEFEFAKEGLSGVVRANTTTNNGPAAGGNRKATVAEQLIKKNIEKTANTEFKVETDETKLTDEEIARRKAEMDKKVAEEHDIAENGPVKDGEKREVKMDVSTRDDKGKNASTVITAQAEAVTDRIIYYGDGIKSEESKVNAETAALSDSELAALKAERTTLLLLQAENFSNMVNFIPDVSGRSESGVCEGLSILENEGSLYDVYAYVLKMSEVMGNELDNKIKAKIEKFRNLLEVKKEKTDLITDEVTVVTEPSPLVNAYYTKMNEYNDAACEYNAKRAAAINASDSNAVLDWALNAKIYYNKVKAAKAAWVSAGYKNEYEQISAFISQIMERDMTLLKQYYIETMEKSTLTSLVSGADFPFTTVVPANFAEASGWTKFTFNRSSYDDNSIAKVKNHSVKVDQTSKSWFHKQHYSYGKTNNSQELNTNFNLSQLKVEFEICQVNIVRPWFKPAFLNSKYWRFDQNNSVLKGQMLSTGGHKPKGLLPAYPTAMILIRNLVIDFGEQSAVTEFMHKYNETSHQGGVGVNIGCFGIGASANFQYLDNNKQDKNESRIHQAGSTIQVPGMQLVGYRCHVLGVSPDPNPDIKNWSNTIAGDILNA